LFPGTFLTIKSQFAPKTNLSDVEIFGKEKLWIIEVFEMELTDFCL